MALREEWCSENLSKLLQEELRISTLSELKDHLIALPRDEAVKVVDRLQLPLIFDCLDDSNNDQIDLACEVLTLCMSNLTVGETASKYAAPLEKMLSHPYSPVKLMALTELEKSMISEEALVEVSKRISLINNVITCIGDNNLGVAKKASNIIVTLGTTIPGIHSITKPDIMDAFHACMAISEVVRLRIYEILVKISVISEHSFNKLREIGFISCIIEELNTNDVLFRMNIVEILTPLGMCDHGYAFLDENKILSNFLSIICISDLDKDVSLLLSQPGIAKFFGNVANKRPLEVLSKYPRFYDYLFDSIESDNLTIVATVLDTLGHIGESNQGKNALYSTGNKIFDVIKTISKMLGSLPTELKISALNCIENLLHVSEHKDNIELTTKRWFHALGENPMEIVLRYAKNPFLELKLAGLGVLKAVAGQLWGQETIKNTPGLIEYLLDRSVETAKECKEKKYEIIQSLALSPVFDHFTTERLNSYVKQGPFYVQAVTEIAIEGNE
ncbi:26S proteasome non-ATPase regulatory subunit 5 [Cylas formicarius]|uniref:26S proteasome non-ATPase regulatory subunit 5 n=1 Tax=Cylas formicarius TaxID=197179 RepID=UPI002958794D|nr:26S proteasome non-ATPase regulatory subunit 5 [Cylas formicarius]